MVPFSQEKLLWGLIRFALWKVNIPELLPLLTKRLSGGACTSDAGTHPAGACESCRARRSSAAEDAGPGQASVQPVPTRRVPGWTGSGRSSRAATETAALARGSQFHARLAQLTPCCFPLCLHHSHAKGTNLRVQVS